MRWVNRYLDTGSVKKKMRYPISYKVTQEQVDYILTIIKSNKTITTNEMLDKLRNRFANINLTSRHISNILRDNNIPNEELLYLGEKDNDHWYLIDGEHEVPSSMIEDVSEIINE